MRRRIASLLAGTLMVVACAEGATTSESPDATTPTTVTLMSHDSFAAAVSDETFATLTERTGISVEVLPAGDAGSMINQAILTKDDPVADALFGIDDTFLSRALAEGVFESREYADIPTVDGIPSPGDGTVVPIDFGDVCLNYDRSLVEDGSITELMDLADPKFEDQLVVESPATSSPGLAFLLATIAEFGEEGWQDYWRSLVANGVTAVADWDQAYYSEFSLHGGDRPLVVSYASSPPAEVIFAEDPPEKAPTGIVEAGCYRQTEFAGVLAGSDQPDDAQKVIDYMRTSEFQEQIPLTWFVFPVNADAALPAEFVEHTTIPDEPPSISAEMIDENRERWIDEWTQIVIP